ncbi:MAG: ABC transporter permease subunit [bacterium]|nr:ABC transporter permease subunit [bacterium]
MKVKTARFFSGPLMKQNIKSNWLLTVVICIVLCMMTTVVSFAMTIMGSERTVTDDKKDAQTEFYTHLFAIASYNQMTDAKLSVEDFLSAEDKTVYDTVFNRMSQQSEEADFSSEQFSSAIDILKDENGSVDSYVAQFEYVYALSDEKGVFSGEELTIDDMLETMLSAMGLPADRLTKMAEMDTTSMLNTMYFTVMGLLPIFIFIVIVGNSLIVNQVDSGSMAYVLATPTKRSAVANTQAIFLVVTPIIICAVGCIARNIASIVFTGETNVKMYIALYFGMYLLAEAVGGICYMGSCLFNQSRKATAFGGGIAVWFFLASLLGMFGAEDMVNMGIGVEELGIFNKLTLVGLYDIHALSTVGSAEVDYSFVWKLCVLAGVAIVTYIIGNIRFQKKDLPL